METEAFLEEMNLKHKHTTPQGDPGLGWEGGHLFPLIYSLVQSGHTASLVHRGQKEVMKPFMALAVHGTKAAQTINIAKRKVWQSPGFIWFYEKRSILPPGLIIHKTYKSQYVDLIPPVKSQKMSEFPKLCSFPQTYLK